MVPVQVLPGLSMLSKQKLRTVIAVDSVAAVDDINSIRNHVSIKTTQTQKHKKSVGLPNKVPNRTSTDTVQPGVRQISLCKVAA